MKRFVLLLFTTFLVNAQAVSLSDLFDAIKQQPATKLDRINTDMAQIAKAQVRANYFPVVNAFADYTHYNSPTNLRPLDPLTASTLISQDKSLPFAQTIQKYGVAMSVPVFAKELQDLSQKAEFMLQSARLRKKLNFYQNEALVLGANANLAYLEHLIQALDATKQSLNTTKVSLEVAVNTGRTPEIALDKIDEKLNQLDITINNIRIKQSLLRETLENLTGIEVQKAATMALISPVQKNELFALKPLQKVIHASMSDLKATQAKRYYPKVTLSAMWSENYTQEDVFKGASVHEGYGYYQLGISLPLYNKNEDAQAELKQVTIMKDKMRLEQTKKDLLTQVKALEHNLVLLARSKKLNEINIQKREHLLQYAKVAYEAGRMIEEDYLDYEDKLLSAKASYYETQSQQWQSIAKLSVIYGNDLKGIVR